MIGSVSGGGAQRQWLILARGLKQAGHEVELVTLSGQAPEHYAPEESGVPWTVLGRGSAFRLGPSARGLRRVIERMRPDVIYAALWRTLRIARRAAEHGYLDRLVWGVRSSGGVLSAHQELHMRRCARESRDIPLIISNSVAGATAAEQRGFRPRAWEVIPNGFDTGFFRPDPELRRSARQRWDLPDEATVIACAARLEATKDHDTLLRAFALLLRDHPDAMLLLAGSGPLQRRLRHAARPLQDRVRFVGTVGDIRSVYNAADMHALSSVAEGMPNAVGEAMACGLPNVVTDAGDCRELVGDSGRVVPVGDAEVLAEALLELSTDPGLRLGLGAAARERVTREYGIDRLIERTLTAFELHLPAPRTTP